MKREKVSAGITAFIDILGFGNRVLSSTSLDDIQSIEKSIHIIRKAFDHETDDESTSEAQKISEIEILAFSDSIIINVPLKSKATKYSGTFDPIMSEIAGFAYAQGECVQNELFIRGGVDIGWWYRDNSTIISQSLTRAYITEGKAKYPIIALTDDLVKYFSEHGDRRFYSEEINPVATSLRKVVVDNKEIYYINYMRICIESLDWKTSNKQVELYRTSEPDEKDRIVNEGYRSNIVGWLTTHAKNIKSAHALASNKDKIKYEWLEEYHNEIAQQYTNNIECLCHLS